MQFRFPVWTRLDWLRSGWMGLVLISASTVIRGLFYLPPVIPPGHQIPALEVYLPTVSWALVWIAAGAFGFLCAGFRRGLSFAVGLATALHVAWGCMYTSAWLLGFSERGYITALSYFSLAALIVWAYSRTSSSIPAIIVEDSVEGVRRG